MGNPLTVALAVWLTASAALAAPGSHAGSELILTRHSAGGGSRFTSLKCPADSDRCELSRGQNDVALLKRTLPWKSAAPLFKDLSKAAPPSDPAVPSRGPELSWKFRTGQAHGSGQGTGDEALLLEAKLNDLAVLK